ncbi:MAG: YggS family pyridoxal phosphate-dependent enzyme [Acidimicrobiales bacterium]
MTVDPSEVRRRLEAVRDRIATAGGDVERVRVCAVTKGFGVDAVAAAVAAGVTDVGENYAQELLEKVDASVAVPDASAIRWHMIGRLQRNKVRGLAPHVHCWQTIDRAALATEVARRAPGATVMVQVAGSDEPGKGGCPLGEVPELVARCREVGLHVDGLMTVGPTDSALDPRPVFEAVSALATDLSLSERSMGMSRDLEAAVASGATMVRVGTALFGARRPRPRPADS